MSNEYDLNQRIAHLANLGTQMSVLLHEIRQPLFAMKVTLDVETQKGRVGSEAYLRLKAQVEHMERLILQYSVMGGDEGDVEQFDLNGPVEETAEWMRPRAKQYGVAFSLELSSDALPVLSRPTNAQQITFNLLQNAYEAVNDGPGRGAVVLRTERTSRWVRLEVEDTAGGIPDSVFDEVTKPFVTTKSGTGGTGLGLYIVQTIVHGANGQLRFIKADKGLRAQVDLPLVS